MSRFLGVAMLLFAMAGGSVLADEGKVVRFSLAADPANLNPLFIHMDADGGEAQLARLGFEPFVDIDEHGHEIPVLLAQIPTRANGGLSTDGRTIIYRLRPEVRWSDGVPVTASDVLFTLRAIRDTRNPVASREGYELIDDARALNARTIRVHLRRPWAPAVTTLFSDGVTPQYVLPEHILGHESSLEHSAFNAVPSVGDGPFVFDSWQRGRRLVYRSNPRYWRGAPSIERVEIPVVPNPGTNLTLLETGDMDFNLIAPIQRAALQGHSEIAFVNVPTTTMTGIAFNTRRPPLNDPRVRRAIAASVDRQGISAKITLGVYPVAESDRPRFSWAYDPSVRQPEYNPRVADADFEAAGWRRGSDGIRRKNGQALELTYLQFPESTTGVRVANVVQEQLRSHGVTVTVKSVSNAQLFLPAAEGGLLASGRFDLAYIPWRMGVDPDDRFLLSCENGSGNYMRYCDPVVNRLETEASQDSDPTIRRTLYRRIDSIVARDVPVLWLFEANYVYAYRATLGGFAPNALVPTWNAYAWHTVRAMPR
ncbi:MAG TPA: peptide ABC transporter substrate-binding protein [Candidatus Baltobacteraceae bacterium]|nr:peptide ABC transporter substrate-binding protein [Candidatus Baltobacteraceae bacterium]